MVVTFLIAVAKHVIKKLKEGLDLTSNVEDQPILAGKPWQQELEAAGHTITAVRKQRDTNAGSLPTSSLPFIFSLKRCSSH